jgi:hypothetical protein
MLERLLESRFKPERSVGGTIASVTGHTALVAAALYATGQTHIRARPNDDVVHVAFLPPTQPVSTANSAPMTLSTRIDGRRPILVNVKIPDISIVPIAADLPPIVGRPGDFARFQRTPPVARELRCPRPAGPFARTRSRSRSRCCRVEVRHAIRRHSGSLASKAKSSPFS